MMRLHEGVTFDDVASVAHEANRAWCEARGDFSQVPWDQAPEWQKDSAKDGVQFHLNNPDAGDSASHDNWMMHKLENGWKLGHRKDENEKTHPCLVPFSQLPFEQRVKDAIFRRIVHAFMEDSDG